MDIKSPSSPEKGRRDQILRVYRSRKETRAYYDHISKFYDLLAEASERPLRAAAMQKLAPRAGEVILEIGSGTGHSLAALGSAVAPQGRVLGLDLSPEMLKNSHRYLCKMGREQHVHLVCGDAVLMPVRAASLDAVLMSFTLELFDTPEIPKLLDECKRVLRPKGRIVVVGMSKEGRKTLLRPAFEWMHRHFPKLLDCRPILVRRFLEESGFLVVSANIKTMWIPVEIVLATR